MSAKAATGIKGGQVLPTHAVLARGSRVQVNGPGFSVSVGRVVGVDSLGISLTDAEDVEGAGRQVFYPWMTVMSVEAAPTRKAALKAWTGSGL